MEQLQIGSTVYKVGPRLVGGVSKRRQLWAVDVKDTVVTEDNRERLARQLGVQVFADFEAALDRAMSLPEVYYDDMGAVFEALEQAAKQ